MDELFQQKGHILMIRIPAELDHYQAEQIRNQSDELLREQNIREIRFDFRNTTFMDSSGIGLLMGRYRTMRRLGGTVRAVHVSERIRKVLTLSGVAGIIEIEPEKTWL